MSRYEDLEEMLRYRKVLDPINAKILEGLGKYGPRNISSMAKSMGLPHTTVSFRLKRLTEKGYLFIHASLDCPQLGLINAVLFSDAVQARLETLERAILNTGYWTYVTRCYGKYDGVYAIFAFPAEHRDKLEDYLKEISRVGILSHYLFFWTTNWCAVTPNFSWFNFKERKWNFRWQEWIDEILNASETLPKSLIEAKSWTITVDETDLLILKELEKDGAADFNKLAKVAKITPESVRYRYNEHVLKRKLILDYQIAIFPYPFQISDLHSFLINFENEKTLAKFANSLKGKPFITSYLKVIGQNSLIVHMYTPKMQFPDFMESMNRMVKNNLIKNFFYVTQDLTHFQRQTVSYEFFKDGSWTYNHNQQMKSMQELVKDIM